VIFWDMKQSDSGQALWKDSLHLSSGLLIISKSIRFHDPEKYSINLHNLENIKLSISW
jgi:hypothetical protein